MDGIYIGLDIGGTKMMAASAREDGCILKRVRQPTQTHWRDDLTLLESMIAEVSAGQRPLAMGAAVGGPLDWQSGIVSPLHQPTWRAIPLKAILEEKYGCPFYVDVDTNVAALGEYYAGQVSARRFLYLTLSTGMGGGFLMDGKLYRGEGGMHPEIAHQAIPYHCMHPDRVRCECGAQGCLEGLISGNAIRRIYARPAEALEQTEWAEVGYNLGQGLRNLAALFAPGLIRLGGGVALGGGERLLEPARQVMADHLRLVPVPQVELSRLGYDTPLAGAIAIAIHGLE